MDFWKIIEASCERPLSVEAAASRLEARLRTLPAEEVGEFCQQFDRLMADAYTWDLWGVAYLINGGCGDDSFMDFRSSLIALGESTFRAATSDAETLLDLPSEELQGLFDEGLLYCGPQAYESLTGGRPDRQTEVKSEPDGIPWDESREALSERFPRAWAVYGWEESAQHEPETPPQKPWWKFW